MADYIHRAGRVGRVGSARSGCRVTNFVGGKIQVHLVQQLEEAVRRWQEIPNVNNNIIRVIREQQRRKVKTDEEEKKEEGHNSSSSSGRRRRRVF